MVKDLLPPMRPRRAKPATEKGPSRSCYCGGTQLLPVIQCENREETEKEFPHLSVGETHLEGCQQMNKGEAV